MVLVPGYVGISSGYDGITMVLDPGHEDINSKVLGN